MFRNTASAPSSRKASRTELRSFPTDATPAAAPAPFLSSGKSLSNRLTTFRTANAPCLCTLTFDLCRRIATITHRGPSASRMARALAGRRSAIAARVPHPCSWMRAVEGWSCMDRRRCGRMEGEEDDDDDDNDDGDEIDARRHSSGGGDGPAVDNNDKEGNDPWQSKLSTKIQTFTRKKPEQPRGMLPMVSWYSNIVFTTGFDMLVSFKIFLGRFDARKMQLALLLNERRREMSAASNDADDRIHNGSSLSDSDSIQYPEGVFDFSHCKHRNRNNNVDDDEDDEGFWFDFVSDCGDGFNSSYQVSRMLAQPTLGVIATTASSSSLSSSSSSPTSSSLKQKQPPKTRILPRGKLLINGGDLAYPDPTPESYEKRFFRTFEDALPPPPSFRREHISIRKPALPVKGWDNNTDDDDEARKGRDDCVDGDNGYHRLSIYRGPCAFLSTMWYIPVIFRIDAVLRV
mmetsp:Transcript_33848/g.71172  ORF Transcript_33848/g.71172 Transcript_33848/m.71172 type:complete len:460 (-) Transcript_33848:5-1384(-)